MLLLPILNITVSMCPSCWGICLITFIDYAEIIFLLIAYEHLDVSSEWTTELYKDKAELNIRITGPCLSEPRGLWICKKTLKWEKNLKDCHRVSFSPNNAELNLGISYSFTQNVHVHGYCFRCCCHFGSLSNRNKQYRITTNQIFGRKRVNLSLLQICLDGSLQLLEFDQSNFNSGSVTLGRYVTWRKPFHYR